jgi:hypothetical protein
MAYPRSTHCCNSGLRNTSVARTGCGSGEHHAVADSEQSLSASTVKQEGVEIDGFYVAYLTGRGGNSILLFAIKSLKLVGVDSGGMKYDGRVEPAANGTIMFHVEYVVAPETKLITGAGSVATATPVSLDFTAPANFAEAVIVNIQTPLGPVNAKISKLRDFSWE